MSLNTKKINELNIKSKKINFNSNIFKIFSEVEKFTTKWESYFNVYEKIFQSYKGKKITFVEVGVSTGGSLQMWRKYFGENARIIGVELNPEAKKLEADGFEIFIGNQSDPSFWKKFYEAVGKIDILLDDGGHKNIQQISTVHNSLPFINDNGLVVVEDTHASYLSEFKNPSYFSFINYCNKIIESIHRRCTALNKKTNIYSDKIFSVNFYESITVFNIDSEKCFSSSPIINKDNWGAAIDQRDNEYFNKTKKYIQQNLSFFDKFKILKKIKRKLLYKNFIFDLFEKLRIYKIYKKLD